MVHYVIVYLVKRQLAERLRQQTHNLRKAGSTPALPIMFSGYFSEVSLPGATYGYFFV
jgi:hypothetical protein